MDIPELLPIQKSKNEQIKNVKANLIIMLSNRGLIEKKNMKSTIDKLINNNNDMEMEFEINIDNPENYNTKIPNKKIHVKFFDTKIMSMSKNSLIGNFIAKYFDEYKILIVENINPKIELTIHKHKTQTEIFKFTSLITNIIDHYLVPKHIVLSPEEKKEVKNAYGVLDKNFPLILSNDPIAKYYNMKQNDVCKIIRKSKNSGRAISYRICV